MLLPTPCGAPGFMKAWEEDGYWYLHVSGGRVGDTFIEPEDVGPLVEPPRLLMEWTELESSAHGDGSTKFTRLAAGWLTFTVRYHRWQPADPAQPLIEFEVVMRYPTEDEFVNPEPPDWVHPDRWEDGWLIL